MARRRTRPPSADQSFSVRQGSARATRSTGIAAATKAATSRTLVAAASAEASNDGRSRWSAVRFKVQPAPNENRVPPARPARRGRCKRRRNSPNTAQRSCATRDAHADFVRSLSDREARQPVYPGQRQEHRQAGRDRCHPDHGGVAAGLVRDHCGNRLRPHPGTRVECCRTSANHIGDIGGRGRSL